MEELRPDDSAARPRRALALIAVALVVLATSAGLYLLRSAANSTPASPKPSGSVAALMGITSVSDREAWVILHDNAASRNVLLHTADGGASWRRMFSIEGFGSLRFAGAGRAVVLSWRPRGEPATGTPQVFSTDDAGAHWRAVTLPEVGAGFVGLPFFLDPDHAWMLATHDTVQGDQSAQDVTLWQTADGGHRWESLLQIDGAHPFSHGISAADQLVSVSFQDRNTGWIVTHGIAASAVVFTTQNGGREWVPVQLPAGLPGPGKEDLLYAVDPVTSPDGRGVLLVDDRTINRTWVYRTLDRGKSWSDPYSAPGIGLNISFVDGSVGWATGSGSAWVTSDSGRSWLPSTGLPGGLQFGGVAPVSASVAWVQGLEVDPASAAQAHWALYRTRDAGLHWTRVSTPSLS
jgi:photosystem II stability/assembly factor-like uncharacterized protein